MHFSSILLLLVCSWIPGSVNGILYPSAPALVPCQVKIKEITSPQPLILQPGTTSMYPFSAFGTIDVAIGGQIELYCPSTYSTLWRASGSVTAICAYGTTFIINGASIDLRMVNCTDWAKPRTRTTNINCNGGKIIESGFDVGTRFVKQLEICFNERLEVTRYVHHTLQPGSNEHQSNVPRPKFATDIFFGGKNVDNLYSLPSVTNAFNRRLGSAIRNYNLNIARGHLAAMVDFVYGTQQRGTFLFVNAAPQWQSINNGNWRRIEDGTRDWVSKNKMRVDCYTGVYGITTLKNSTGFQKELYLDYGVNNNGLIPVPMLFFRVIIEPSTNRGIVLITVNNPHQVLKNYVVCPDVSNQVHWVKWDKRNIYRGYSYACEVADFARINHNLPNFHVRALLR